MIISNQDQLGQESRKQEQQEQTKIIQLVIFTDDDCLMPSILIPKIHLLDFVALCAFSLLKS